jgi:hypothetical protein
VCRHIGALITVWLEVRILPGPPGSPTLGEISWLLPNGPELAGSAARVRVSAETNDTEQAFSAELSLVSEFRFPATDIPQVEAGSTIALTEG